MTTPIQQRLAVCSWSLQPASTAELITKLAAVGVSRIQLSLGPLHEGATGWEDQPAKQLRDAGIEIVSGMFGTIGEDYTTLDTIRATGGIVPDEHWPANRENAAGFARIAQSLGLPRVSFHAGFIPHDAADPGFTKLTDRLGELADLFAAHQLDLLLETGQETADALNACLDAVARPNLKVNFDPANMILYGMGDPIESLRKLMPRVGQVHIKDALPSDTPGQWGTETPVGQGAVDWPAFLAVLNDADYTGDLAIEREAGDARVEDARRAASHLLSLT